MIRGAREEFGLICSADTSAHVSAIGREYLPTPNRTVLNAAVLGRIALLSTLDDVWNAVSHQHVAIDSAESDAWVAVRCRDVRTFVDACLEDHATLASIGNALPLHVHPSSASGALATRISLHPTTALRMNLFHRAQRVIAPPLRDPPCP